MAAQTALGSVGDILSAGGGGGGGGGGRECAALGMVGDMRWLNGAPMADWAND